MVVEENSILKCKFRINKILRVSNTREAKLLCGERVYGTIIMVVDLRNVPDVKIDKIQSRNVSITVENGTC